MNRQEHAIDHIRNLVNDSLMRHAVTNYGAKITEFNVEDHNGFVSVAVQTEYTALPENNYLRAISHEWWLFFIGKRGAITVRTAPKSMHQFHGTRAHRMNWKLR